MFDWWKRILGRTKQTETASSSEHDSAAIPRAEPEAPAAPTLASRLTAQADALAAETCPEEFKTPAGWLSSTNLKLVRGITNEKLLIRRIRTLIPAATDEDARFRMLLSEAIRLGEYSIPIFPVTALRVLNLGRKSNVSLNDYARLIESDPSMAKTILRRANSAYYSTAGECTSLAQAMSVLGISELDRLVLISALGGTVFRVRGYDALVASISRHGLAAALSTQHLCELIGINPSEGFLAGLFHDSGKLVIMRIIGDAQRKLHQTAPEAFPHLAFDAFHAVVGESACRKWGMPSHVARAVGNHHRWRTADEPLDTAVYHGNLVAHASESEEPQNQLPTESPAVNAAKLDREKMLAIAAQTKLELADYAQFLKWN